MRKAWRSSWLGSWVLLSRRNIASILQTRLRLRCSTLSSMRSQGVDGFGQKTWPERRGMPIEQLGTFHDRVSEGNLELG
jgi:hypothetical protein